LELMIAVVIVTIAAGAAARAFIAGLGYEQRFVENVEARADRVFLEDSMARLLVGAQLQGDDSYFVSPIPNLGTAAQSGASGLGTGASSIAFTTTSRELPPRYLQNRDTDWQTLNERFGPEGGATEVAFSTTPAGDAGALRGLFLREQIPPDAEASRGGKERLLDERVQDIRFEFYDGTNWKDTWDSRGETDKGKLPATVRVSYVLNGDTKPRSFLVRLPLAGAKGGSS
jgi:hypothetical protein